VFGDSLSAAYNMQQKQGWVALLAQRLSAQQYNYQVVNASISGETTSGGFSRFAGTIKTHKPAIVILELGGNDGLRGLSASETYQNLDAMINQAKPAKVLLLGMKIPPNYGIKYSQQFNQNYENLAKKHQANLVPFFLENVAGKPELIQADGLHPTAAAQTQLLENVWPMLEKMLKK
jgi:acyl-CoA thioesterase I